MAHHGSPRMLLMMATLVVSCSLASCMRTGGMSTLRGSSSSSSSSSGGGRALSAMSTAAAAPSTTAASFYDAPACLKHPIAGSSSPDDQGRLWGWEAGRSCAFRTGAGRPLFYTGYEPGSWVLTPSCRSEPFAQDAVTDSRFKTWAWESGKLCAYKDDQLQPVPFTKLPTRASWAAMPACASKPTPATTAPDKLNRLWGWERNRNCPFKSATGEPVYYDGYLGARYEPPAPPPSPSPAVASPTPNKVAPAPAAAPTQPAQPDAPPCSTNTTAEALARAVADRLWEKMAAATNGYESSTPLDLEAAAEDAGAALVKAASDIDAPDEVQAAQADDAQVDEDPAATPLEVAHSHRAPARYTDAQVEALVDAPAPEPAGDAAAVAAAAVDGAQAGIEAAGGAEPSSTAAAGAEAPTPAAADENMASHGSTAAAVLQALEAVVAAADDEHAAAPESGSAASESGSAASESGSVGETARPTPRMAAELLPGAAAAHALPAPTAAPKIVGDTLSKPAATAGLPAASLAAPPSLDADAPTSAGGLLGGSAFDAAQGLAEMLTDGGPGGVAPPGTRGTGGAPIDAPLPPDAQFPAFRAAAAQQAPAVRRAPADPSLIREPTGSYSPGGITPPSTHGSAGQVTLVPGGGGGAAGDFGAASSADEAVDYVPMGPTSRGGRFARLAPGRRLLARPAERATVPPAASPVLSVGSKRAFGPGAVKEIANPQKPAAARNKAGGRSLLEDGSPSVAPQVETAAEAHAGSASSSESLRISGAASDAQASSDGADASAAARAAAFALEAHSSNASASAAAASFVNVTNPDGSWSALWSNASSSSWSRSWNASWSAAESEASAAARGGGEARADAAAAAAAAGGDAAAAEAGAGASTESGSGSTEAAAQAHRKLMDAGSGSGGGSDDPWLAAPQCAVAVGGPNTIANITRDDYGRYWGFQAGASCAFRGVDIAALKYAERAPYDSPTFAAAPPCPAGAADRSKGSDGHEYGWDGAARVKCTFDKPHPSRPPPMSPPAAVPAAAAAAADPFSAARAAAAAPAAVAALTAAPAATSALIAAPAKLAAASSALDRARRFPDGGGTVSTEDATTFTAAELPPELPPPTVAAGVASVAALTRAQAVASSIVAEAVGRASSLLRALDDQVQQVLSGERVDVADGDTGEAAAAGAAPAVAAGEPTLPASPSKPPITAAKAAAPAAKINSTTPAMHAAGSSGTNSTTPAAAAAPPSPLVVVERHWREIRRPNVNDAGPDDDAADADYAVDGGRYDYEAAAAPGDEAAGQGGSPPAHR